MHKDCSGFTLLELIIVLVIVGTLSANAVIRWPDDGDLKLPAQADLFATHIRHIQSLAVYWGEPLRLTITANDYSVDCVTASVVASSPCFNSPVIDPVTGQDFQIGLESGITLGGTATTEFDVIGRPVNGGVLISGAPPARTFTLTGGTDNWTVTVDELTGFVAASP